MTFRPGDDILVEFCGLEHTGEYVAQSGNFHLCRILIDPTYDYDVLSARLAPISFVAVRTECVKPR